MENRVNHKDEGTVSSSWCLLTAVQRGRASVMGTRASRRARARQLNKKGK
jgi:hypothetical protein